MPYLLDANVFIAAKNLHSLASVSNSAKATRTSQPRSRRSSGRGLLPRGAGPHEQPSASTRRIEIPDACLGLGIKFMTPFEMLRRERARFILGP